MRESIEWPTHDPLTHRTAATPNRTALVDADTGREWTFRALSESVAGLATSLEALPGEGRVGLLASTRVGFVATVHAAWRTGRTVVPFNLEVSDDTLTRQIAATSPDCLVCERTTESRARPVFDGQILSLDDPQHTSVSAFEPDEENTAFEPETWTRTDCALVLFTSGTTGKPKAVQLTLENLLASATAAAFRLGVAPDDRWLCCLPTYHMGGLAPIVRTALYGTTLVLDVPFDTQRTGKTLNEEDITGVSLVPTMLHRLIEDGWTPPETLETVLLGGAPASEQLIQRALARDVAVYPTYGMTETASQIATATPQQVDVNPETVGHPLLGTEVTVVDEAGDPVETGERGELVVDGPAVTPGYLDEEATFSAFGEHGLHTGDIGRRDEDGRVRVVGRVDDMLVTGGENVHPATVTDVLESHHDVATAAVVGLPDPEWGERVAALIVPDDDSLTESGVETYARERLASYKVPKTVAFADDLPRTPSGTVDRAAVRAHLQE